MPLCAAAGRIRAPLPPPQRGQPHVHPESSRARQFTGLPDDTPAPDAARRILAPSEIVEFEHAHEPARFLAKRFAAKEALGKALGTGVRAPVLLRSIAVTHDDLGKPAFVFDELLTQWLEQRGLQPHLSLSDETAYALAFVVVERVEKSA